MRIEKENIQKVIPELLGRTTEHYLFAYIKQLSNLLSLHSYTVYLVCLV